MPMKTRVLLLAALAALASCTQQVHESDGMTAGEEVLWMHDWMERVYGPEPENGYDFELYEEQAPSVKEYVYDIIQACTRPDSPADLVNYFKGVPHHMIVGAWAWDDEAELNAQTKRFWDRIQMLQDYNSGKSEYFPSEELLSEVNWLLDMYQDVSSHSGYESSYEYSYLLLAHRLIQQLVRLCPDIDMIASESLGEVAVINFDHLIFYPPVSVLLLETEDDVYLPIMVEGRSMTIKPGDMDEGVYHLYSDCGFEAYPIYQKVCSIQKVLNDWRLWYRYGEERGFLPGKTYYIPDSLEDQLESLRKVGEVVFPNKVQDDTLRLYQAVRALDAYAHGERRYYPDKLFRDAFEFMAFATDWDANHGSEAVAGHMCALACLMEFAAYHAPDINYLTDFVSADHNVGVFEYQGATIRNFNLFVTYKEHGVFRIKTLNTDDWGSDCGYEGPNWLTHVRKIGADDARMYLFSHEYVYSFAHCLCWYDEYGDAHFFVPDNLNECISEWLTDDIRSMSDDEVHIVYNPKNVCWNVCTKVGSSYQPVKDSKTLYLELDGLNSRYRLE